MPTNRSTVSLVFASSSASFNNALSFSDSILSYPCAYLKVMFSDSKLSYALSSLYGFIVELPAPWYLGFLAISPITAMF